MIKLLNKFKQFFSDSKWWSKLKAELQKLSSQMIYSTLLLFYAYKRRDTPAWARSIIIGALGYFIAPIDALPDLSPIVGYTDDLGILSFAIVTIACYINEEVRDLAKEKLEHLVGHVDPNAVEEVEALL